MSSLPLDPERIRQCYLASMDSTQRIVSGITESAWTNATPCDDWNVKDIVNHLVYENVWAVELLNGKSIGEVGDAFEGDLVGQHPQQKYESTTKDVRMIIERPDSMSLVCQISSGPIPGSEYAAQLFLDTLIHGWDIAVGSGQPGNLDSGLIEACIPLAVITRDAVGEGGSFGNTVETQPQSDPQARLLALLGRDSPVWQSD